MRRTDGVQLEVGAAHSTPRRLSQVGGKVAPAHQARRGAEGGGRARVVRQPPHLERLLVAPHLAPAQRRHQRLDGAGHGRPRERLGPVVQHLPVHVALPQGGVRPPVCVILQVAVLVAYLQACRQGADRRRVSSTASSSCLCRCCKCRAQSQHLQVGVVHTEIMNVSSQSTLCIQRYVA